MRRKFIYLIACACLAVTLLVSYKQVEPSREVATLLIVVDCSRKNMDVHISGRGQAYEQLKVKGASEFDYTELIALLAKYEKQGWHIQESNFAKSSTTDARHPALPDHFNLLYFRLVK